jgi:16S rRNA (uracil1498-N3)-methyltransferase
MARVFVEPQLLAGPRVTLDRAASKHLVRVLRLPPGSDVCVFDGRGTEIDATIVSDNPNGVELALGQSRQVPLPAGNVTLVQSVPRGERMDLIVQKTTELGVSRIVPVVSAHGVVKPTPAKSRRWQTIAQEAARQSGRADVPEIADPVSLDEALRAIAQTEGPRLVLWEEERTQPMRRVLAQLGPGPVTLLVGPEGGFAAPEVDNARAHGFVSVSIGPRILRVETAALVAVALTQAALGALD